jgi:hypothetical protein
MSNQIAAFNDSEDNLSSPKLISDHENEFKCSKQKLNLENNSQKSTGFSTL